MSRIRRGLSFSNVVACLALFVALGGTVYAAGKISGKQIKPHSLPGNRLKPKTLTGHQIKAHSLKGAQIDQSTLNAVAAASLAGVQYATASVTLGGLATTTASCPAGTNVIGGGATVSDEDRASVNDSGPNQARNGWTATGFGFGPVRPVLLVTAVCAVLKAPVAPGPVLPPAYHPAG